MTSCPPNVPAEPPHSCPEFDAAREKLSQIQEELANIERAASAIDDLISNCETDIEHARDINDTLRKRAEGWEEAWSDMDSELDAVKDELAERNSELESLRKELEALEAQINEIEEA